MAKYSIEDTTLTNIAEAIRTKGNTTDSLTPLQMPDAINAIQTGGGSAGSGGGMYLDKTPEQIYAETRSSIWPVLPEPTQDNEFYFLCATNTKGKVVYPYCGKAINIEWGYIDDNGAFVVVSSATTNSLTYWSETSISSAWVSPQMDNYYVMRTTGADCSYEKAASGTADGSTMKHVLEIKARCSNPSFRTIPRKSGYTTNGFKSCQYITLYGPQDWGEPGEKFYQTNSLVALVFKDDNPFAKPSTATSVYRMFYGCQSLATPYCELFKNWTSLTDVREIYYNCQCIPELDIDLSNTPGVKELGYLAYGAKSVMRFSVKAPYVTTGYCVFQSADTYRLVVSNLDLSSHAYPSNSYTGVAYASEIYNLKLSGTTNMAGSNPGNPGDYLQRLTMAPDATADNVPPSWKVRMKYASYGAVREFFESLPVTTKSKQIAFINVPLYNSSSWKDLTALAVGKGYTLAVSST